MELIKKSFEELTTKELHGIYKLRSEVFVLEQHCIYGDVDENDLLSMHYFFEENGEIISYLRVIPRGIVHDYRAIGRVVTRSDKRSQKLSRRLMEEVLKDYNEDLYLSAQTYILKFYQAFGFEVVSEPYDDAGIMHVDMVLKKK
ncbi:GNAT family N-acetyltransferase [Guggenheimella bovis]